jgi:hypothetical protein
LSTIKYGFSTKADTAEQSTLGHTLIVRGTVTTGLVIGANNIKPARASKNKLPIGTSAFVDYEKRADAIADGWKITPGKNTQRRSTHKTKAVYATINGVKVGYQLPELIGSTTLSTLGLIEAGPTDFDIFYGCSVPKAPRARTIYSTGASGSSVYDPTVTLPAEWDTFQAAKLLVN